MIKITIKCFSQVKYALGTDSLVIELEEGSTLNQLEKLIRKKAKDKLAGVDLRIAINKKYSTFNNILRDGDEVAFIPPVQGG